MPTGLGNILGGLGLPAAGSGIEADLAALLGSATPEGWLAKGALAAVGGLAANTAVKDLLGGKKKSRRSTRRLRSRGRSTRSRSHKSRTRMGSRRLKFGSRAYRMKYLHHK